MDVVSHPVPEERDVVLDLRAAEGSHVLSDLTSGPLPFAAC
ncbi:hypothetical protein AAII07_43855 [Microvirga sp. 0TCS3.31]